MCNISNIVKLFLMKLYALIILFLLIFGCSYLHNLINNNPNILDKGSYVSVGELAISSNSVNSQDNLTTYMQNIVHRSKNEPFLQYVLGNLKSEVDNPTGSLAQLNLTEENKNTLKSFNESNIREKILVEVKESTTILVISFSDKNSAAIAQAVNTVIMDSMYKILPADTNNILGGVIENVELEYKIGNKASLPAALTTNVKIDNNESINILKIAVISLVVYIVYVLVMDFALGFISSKQKARTLVKTNIISEIEIPYFKSSKDKEKK